MTTVLSLLLGRRVILLCKHQVGGKLQGDVDGGKLILWISGQVTQ